MKENQTIKLILEQLSEDFPDYRFIAYNKKEQLREQYPPTIFHP